MEVLQCDGCDFRAESYDDLKTHIQDVHTAFLQPADADESDSLKDGEEDEEADEELEDRDDKDYAPPKAGMSPNSADISSQPSQKQTAETHLQFYQCKFCVRYFRSKSFLRNHTKKVHNSVEDDSEASISSQAAKEPSYTVITHNDHTKVYSCQYCTYKSPRKARIVKHQAMYHNKAPSEGGDDVSENADAGEESDSASEFVKGMFACEWCDYQTDQKDSWTSHVVKEHSDKVKIVSSTAELEAEAGASSPPPDSPSSPRSPTRSKITAADDQGNEEHEEKILENPSGRSVTDVSSFLNAQMSAATPNSTGSSILSKRFASADGSGRGINLLHEDDSRSSQEDENEEEELGDMDDAGYTGTLSADAKQLLTDEDNKLLETKGIPFRKYMNRFQCPFCSFLTMHRRSISRHIENIHLSGKTTVYKCDECPFICTSPLKLGTHKQSHSSSDLDTMDLTSDSPEPQTDGAAEPVNGGSMSSKVNGKKITSTPNDQQNPHRCTLCSFSTTTLKGLRVHQQHKHSYCDDLDPAVFESQLSDQLDSEVDASPIFLQKTQTSILGLATKKPLATGKRARKSINDLPLDLSSVKKRTRIDEIASNLQSKISQSQQDMIINLDDMDDEDAGENHTDKSGGDHDGKNAIFTYNTQQLHARESGMSHEGGRIGKRKSNPKSKPRNIPISLTLSDDSENISADPSDNREAIQENSEFSEDAGTARFYCKHCDYHNKSARSVSTHYQRMHPYIKFSFKYILDPEDHSAVFRCLECYIEYTNYNDLHQHYMDHHPEASNVLNFNQPNLVYMCRFCSYTSPNVRSLMPHYQRMHPTVKINNAMIFSSYVVEQSHKTGESQTLREILNSGPKSFNSATSTPRSSSSPVLKTPSKTPEASAETDSLKEVMGGNVVVYDCDVCSFASPNMHSVLVHYQKKHPEQKASYFRIQKTMKVISVDQTQPVANSSFNLSMTSPQKQSNAAALYGSDEEMFYCKHCVYSNRSVVGVLVHYQKRHPEVKVTAKYIKHGAPTPGLMKLMDELQIATPKQFLTQFQNNGHNGSNNSSPKAGSGEKSEDELFFCQHCDYGNRTVKGVLIHYQKKHRETKANADLVRRHTAVVRSQRERAQMGQSGSISSAAAPPPPDPENSSPLRSLKCRHCSHTSPYVYALKKHLKKEHPAVKATAMTILHWAYQDGILEAGYHCEWCIYSHAEPQGLLLHYQRRHPEHNVDYTYMASKLWAGPETTQQGGNAETKHYKCKDCAFEACSIWDITSHYQAVHPWAIKGDESVLLDIIKGNPSAESFQQQLAKDFNCQSLEDDGALIIATPPQESNPHPSHPRLSISNNAYQCTVCLSEYNSLHGLLTHYGKKHPGMKVKAADFAQEADINPSSVYKCRHCPYVNSRIHGVLTHYQKRHPLVKVTAEDFANDIEQISDVNEGEEKCKTQRQGYGAYRCKMCPYTHGTLEKLKIHYEKYHNQSASEMFAPSLTHFSAGKDMEPVAECSAGSISSSTEVQEVSELDFALSQLPINKVEKHAVFKCQLCKYFCSTRKGIARHYRIKHNNVRAQPEGKNNVFKCALCSYTNPIRKGLAAHYQKRHDIDAYYTHCLAASKTLTEKPSKVMVPVPSENENSEMSEDLRLAVERRRCSLCAFQAFSRKSIVSHYIKRHPGVFPKKQHASKLGRYFTVIYAKEPEKVALEEDDKEMLEAPLEEEPDAEGDWLPFKCLKCFRLSFSSGQLLSMHYNDHHSNDLKRDFVVSPGLDGLEDEEEELYQCSHCELKFLALPVLASHLLNHNDEFQKRATRQERRRQLLSKHKASDLPDSRCEKESPVNKTPVGFRCNFCVEVHPTLRAICNHLRKHVQYGEVKEGHIKQEVTEVPLTLPTESLTNGDLEGDEVAAEDELERPAAAMMGPSLVPAGAGGGGVATDTLEPEMDAVEGRAAALVAAARAAVAAAAAAGGPLKQRLTAGGHPCAQCDRVFMSMQGLRSHERSHSAMALFSREDKYSCQYCQFVSPFRHNLDRHVQSHHGHHKPFKCKLCPFKSAYVSRLKSHLHKAHSGEQHTYKCLSCPFSSMTISQLKEHSLRDHGEALTLPKLRAATQAAAHATLRPPRPASSAEQAHMPPDDPSYLEPADVRQQLSHYQLASRSHMSSGSTPGGGGSSPDGVLTCEFCEFSSGYMQSLRRHYRDRHGGKKLFKCKDCSYFTCYKNTFTMHVEAGHNNGVPEDVPKDLRCPLCLYHTKHKSNMIDHIVLHREERVAPLEVSRSKLSRHLQGLVFRCHKCTFTCSSDQALQLHLQKHAEIKPYQCQLCYYDSSRRSQLEEHLRLEHKVIRNFELMGRVNLDQLEMIKEQGSSTDDEEERELMELAMDGKVSAAEEEEGLDDDEQMEMMENMADAHRDMDGEELQDHVKGEDELYEEEEEREEVGEVDEDKHLLQGVLASPTSSSSAPNSAEKRIPCEFCGRCFTNSSEWERHVLRHGMMVNSSQMDTSTTSAIEASAPTSTASSVPTDAGLDLSSSRKEDEDPADQSQRSQSQYMEDKEMLDTKKDQQFG